MDNTETIVRVECPDFVASFVIKGDHCTSADPLLKWAVGRRRETLREYFRLHGWKATIVPDREAQQSQA